MPVVSVIVPNYNHAPYLKRRLDSILNQSYDDFDVTILDDCSTDSSRILIDTYRNHPKVSGVVYNKTNSGSTFHQWNKGVELSKGEIIWIAESDDFADHDFLSALVPVMLDNHRIGIAYSQSFQVNTEEEIIWNFKHFTDNLSLSQFKTDFTMRGRNFIEQFLVHKNVIPNASGAIFRKSYYQQVGGAEPSIKYCSDWFTWIKILFVSDVFFSATPRNYFRYHEQSVIARAGLENKPGHYVEIYDRAMRKRLNSYLKEKVPESKDISHKNHRYVLRENSNEGLHDIRKKRLFSGWQKIMKSFHPGANGFNSIKEGLKESVKVGLGRR